MTLLKKGAKVRCIRHANHSLLSLVDNEVYQLAGDEELQDLCYKIRCDDSPHGYWFAEKSRFEIVEEKKLLKKGDKYTLNKDGDWSDMGNLFINKICGDINYCCYQKENFTIPAEEKPKVNDLSGLKKGDVVVANRDAPCIFGRTSCYTFGIKKGNKYILSRDDDFLCSSFGIIADCSLGVCNFPKEYFDLSEQPKESVPEGLLYVDCINCKNWSAYLKEGFGIPKEESNMQSDKKTFKKGNTIIAKKDYLRHYFSVIKNKEYILNEDWDYSSEVCFINNYSNCLGWSKFPKELFIGPDEEITDYEKTKQAFLDLYKCCYVKRETGTINYLFESIARVSKIFTYQKLITLINMTGMQDVINDYNSNKLKLEEDVVKKEVEVEEHKDALEEAKAKLASK